MEQLHDSTATLFREVPKLAGLFTITMSENLTNCISRVSETGPCPTCSARNPAEIIAEEAPDVRVSVSSRVLPTIREYPRLSTTVIDASLTR